MENQSNPNAEARENGTSLPALLQQIHDIATNVGNATCADALIEKSMDINEKIKHLHIVGPVNGDFLNRLIGEDVFGQSILPVTFDLEIAPTSESEQPYCIIEDKKLPLQLGVFKQVTSDQKVKIFLDNALLRQHDLQVSICQYPGSAIEDPSALIDFFSKTDAILFLTDALGALKRNEVQYFKSCLEKKIPFWVGISRLSLVEPDERASVKEYVNAYLQNHFGYADIIDADEVADHSFSINSILKPIERKLETIDLQVQRLNFFMDRVVNCLFNLRSIILNKQNEAASRVQDIKDAEAKEKIVIGNQNDQWARIQNVLVEKRQNIEKQLRDHLAKNRKQVMESLLFEINRSNDAKNTWERDLPFFINKELTATAERLNSSLQRQIMDSQQWLGEEIFRVFNYKLPLENKGTMDKEVPVYTPKELKLMNTQKLRMRSRLGNAATIIGAGTLFLSAPIGGAVIATSIVYQALVDQYISSKTKKEKEKIKDELSKVIETVELQFVGEFADGLKEIFDEILTKLKASQGKWLKDQNSIATEKTAHKLKNAGAQGLEEPLKDINKLIAQFV